LSLWQAPPVAAPSVIVAMEMNINAARILPVDAENGGRGLGTGDGGQDTKVLCPQGLSAHFAQH